MGGGRSGGGPGAALDSRGFRRNRVPLMSDAWSAASASAGWGPGARPSLSFCQVAVLTASSLSSDGFYLIDLSELAP